MLGFVMVVSGKWSKVVVFALEPAFYYLCRVHTVHGKPGKPGKRNFFERVKENLENSGNSLTIFTTSGKTQGILFCQTSLIK